MANCSLSTNGNGLNKFHITDIICDRLGSNGAPTRQMFKVRTSSKWWCVILPFLADTRVGHLHLWHCGEVLFIPENEPEKWQEETFTPFCEIISIKSVCDLLAGVFGAWKQQALMMERIHLVTRPWWQKANHPVWFLHCKMSPPTPLFSCATLSHNVPFALPRQHDDDENWSSGGKIHNK